MRTNFFCTNFLNTARGPGHPGQNSGIWDVLPSKPKEDKLSREGTKFSATTPSRGRPPPGGLRTQKVNLCAPFSCLMGGSQAPPSFWKVPGLPQKFPQLPRKFFGNFPRSSLTMELNSNPEVPGSFPGFSGSSSEVPRKFPGLPQKFLGWKATKEYLNQRGTKIRLFRVCFRAPFFPPFFPHFSPLFPLQALCILAPLLPSSPPPSSPLCWLPEKSDLGTPLI